MENIKLEINKTLGFISKDKLAAYEPKVRACIQFCEKTGKEALITMANELGKSGAGTIIYAE